MAIILIAAAFFGVLTMGYMFGIDAIAYEDNTFEQPEERAAAPVSGAEGLMEPKPEALPEPEPIAPRQSEGFPTPPGNAYFDYAPLRSEMDCDCYANLKTGGTKHKYWILSAYAYNSGKHVGFTWVGLTNLSAPSAPITRWFYTTPNFTLAYQDTNESVQCVRSKLDWPQHPVRCSVPSLQVQELIVHRGYIMANITVEINETITTVPDVKMCYTPRPPGHPAKKVHEVAICTSLRDNSEYLIEWVEWHKRVGIDHIYIYNDASTDNIELTLSSYLCEGYVTLLPWNYSTIFNNGWLSWASEQFMAHNDCIYRFRDTMKYVYVVDSDEFVLPPPNTTIKDVLRGYEHRIGVDPAYIGFKVGTKQMGRASKDWVDKTKFIMEQYPLQQQFLKDPKSFILADRVDYMAVHTRADSQPRLQDKNFDILHYTFRKPGRTDNTTGWVDVSPKVWGTYGEWMRASFDRVTAANADLLTWSEETKQKKCALQYHLSRKCLGYSPPPLPPMTTAIPMISTPLNV